MAPSTTPLISGSRKDIVLYDPTSMVQIDKQLAHGYVVMLGGPPSAKDEERPKGAKKRKIDEDAITLGFLALTQGNVVDACFGIRGNCAKPPANAGTQVKRIKSMLTAAADSSDGIRRRAVETYRQAFLEILRFHEQVAKLNFFTSCFRYGKIQHETELTLQEIFQRLQEVVATSR